MEWNYDLGNQEINTESVENKTLHLNHNDSWCRVSADRYVTVSAGDQLGNFCAVATLLAHEV